VRFLVRNAMSPLIAERLRQDGHDAVHVCDYRLQAGTHDDIFDPAHEEEGGLTL
jgi:Domain of unknown function (DUF5615)